VPRWRGKEGTRNRDPDSEDGHGAGGGGKKNVSDWNRRTFKRGRAALLNDRVGTNGSGEG